MAVKRVFIAASRSGAAALSVLAGDMTALGYRVHHDGQLPGGSDWWARTLDNVASADAFVYALTSASVASSACQEAMEYALTLGQPILPVLLDDDVSDADLPTSLGAIQRVDYRDPSASAMAELFSALRGLPEVSASAGTVTRPECPSEFALDVRARLASPVHLTRPEQDSILGQLEAYVEGGFSTTELEPLLRDLHERRLDLTVSFNHRLDELERALAASTPLPPSLESDTHALDALEGDPPVRSLFLSYSRAERGIVDHLVTDIRRLGFTIWIDQNLPGGKPWWDQVLLNIREADAFVLAAGPASLTSRACIAELDYATQLGKPIARFDLEPNESRTAQNAAWAGAVAASYRPDDKSSIASIATMVTGLSRTVLPAVLPPLPDVPATYTFDVQNQLRSATEMNPEQQAEVIEQIRQYAEEGVSLGDLGRLLNTFKKRPDITMRSQGEVATLEGELGISAATQDDKVSEQTRRDAQAEEARAAAEAETEAETEAEQGRMAAAAASRPQKVPELPVLNAPSRRRRSSLVVLGLLIVAAAAGAGVWALSNRSDTSAGTNSLSNVVDPAAVTAQPQPSAQAPPTTSRPATTGAPATTAPQTTTFGGVTGQAQVEWTAADGIFYSATISTVGTEGVADVQFFDATGASFWIREDLTMQSDEQGVRFVGSSPRLMPSEVPTVYSPDTFRMTQRFDGFWEFDAVCDATGCFDATHTPL